MITLVFIFTISERWNYMLASYSLFALSGVKIRISGLSTIIVLYISYIMILYEYIVIKVVKS